MVHYFGVLLAICDSHNLTFAKTSPSVLHPIQRSVARDGYPAVLHPAGEAGPAGPGEGRRPPRLPQSPGAPLEVPEPGLGPRGRGGGGEPPPDGAAGPHGQLQRRLLPRELPAGHQPAGAQCLLPPRAQPRAQGQLPSPVQQLCAPRGAGRNQGRSRAPRRAPGPGSDPAQGTLFTQRSFRVTITHQNILFWYLI